MLAVPICADSEDKRTVHVWAMLRGKTGKMLWVELSALGWLVSYACNEYMRLGLPRAPRVVKESANKKANTYDNRVFRQYDYRTCHWHFEFVKEGGV